MHEHTRQWRRVDVASSNAVIPFASTVTEAGNLTWLK